MHTLDLRDRMTARHCAAVARYSKEIARRGRLLGGGAGPRPHRRPAARHRQVHLPRPHPQGRHEAHRGGLADHPHAPLPGRRGSSRQIEGYGPVGDIILAHHERIDGKGYPRGLKGDEIPALSRIISVADIYDVMTARDSYRKPVSSFEAIQELRRVAGTQLDAEFVEIFIQVLAGKDVQLPPRRGRRLRRRARPREARPRRTPPGAAGGSPSRSTSRRRPTEAEDAGDAALDGGTRQRPPDKALATLRFAQLGGGPLRRVRCSRSTPAPSSNPASCVRRGTTSMCQWKCSAPRGAVRTQRFSGGGAPSTARSR